MSTTAPILPPARPVRDFSFLENTMNMVETLDAHADWLERQADKADVHEEHQRAGLAFAWDECLKARNIDAPIGGGYYSDLIEVLNDACSDGDQTIHRACMQALVNCAANGQIEAVHALDKVKAFFVNETMEFYK
jgi:hypothetical protein